MKSVGTGSARRGEPRSKPAQATKLGPAPYHADQSVDALHRVLRRHPNGLTIERLAARMRVTERSVRRYLDELERRVKLLRTKGAGPRGATTVKLASLEPTKAVYLHATQLEGLLMGRHAIDFLDGTFFADATREAYDLLLGQLPTARHVKGGAMREGAPIQRFLYLPESPMRPLRETPELIEVIDTIIDAAARHRVCILEYRKYSRGEAPRDRPGERLTMHPYGFVLNKGALYCIGRVAERDALRSLRVDRMADVDLGVRARRRDRRAWCR